MRLSWLRRQSGGQPVSVLALALLVVGCVFVAVAGPRYSLHARTSALRQELAALTPADRTIQVTDDWNSFASQVTGSGPAALAGSQLSESQRQLARFLTATPLPLGADQWAGLSTDPLTVTAGAPPSAKPSGVAPRLEVLYRDPLRSNVTLVAGSFPPPSSLGTTLDIADLSVFTGSSAPVPVAPDLLALAGPAAGLAVLTAVSMVAETRLLRHRDVPGLLRIGG
jgi:hypothetical protein